MNMKSCATFEKKIILNIRSRVCETPDELLSSESFRAVLKSCLDELHRRKSRLIHVLPEGDPSGPNFDLLVETLKLLTRMEAPLAAHALEGAGRILRDPLLLNDFVEHLYDYWRSFDRFIICDSGGDRLDRRPYRTFNETIERLTHLVRSVYRDIGENITGNHPRVYRQVRAGAEVAAISIPRAIPFGDDAYSFLNEVPVIRQVLLYPPEVINPPMNKRTGEFVRVEKNPFDVIEMKREEWLCYPARVGKLVILIYFHMKFYELGFSLCNLFELAGDEDLARKPDAIYAFGVPGDALDGLGEYPTVFFDDVKNGMLTAACPNRDEFGYFGYLKKMVLTLHNVIMMKRKVLPFHGALVRILLDGDRDAAILLIGDTGAGKSETLEAFRVLGDKYIRDIIIIADDMGSLEITPDGAVMGYGTEIGAFLRLDDLQPGYAFGHLDRSIIMNPAQVNARIVIPVTTYENIITGCKVDYILYANNYEDIDPDHPLIERFDSPEDALRVFRDGAVMSKGTTTSKGLVHSYFANIFGPPQYRELHDELAARYFDAFFRAGVFVGQMRTRLGIAGYERKGPEEASLELLRVIGLK